MYLHSSGTKHKTILEARSGLGPIKAYPRLGPKPSGEQGGEATDPDTQERTFHCEICNVRVNSELQLKQVSNICELIRLFTVPKRPILIFVLYIHTSISYTRFDCSTYQVEGIGTELQESQTLS